MISVRTRARIAQVHHLSKNGGKAEAVRKGMLHVLNRHNLTNADVIAFWDADLVRGREREGEGRRESGRANLTACMCGA